MAVRDLGIVTAYGYAKAGGYEGTEQEFTALLGNLALTVEDLENMTVSVTTLEPNQQATASYADGVLSLGIPKGVAGEVQFSDLEPLAEKNGNYENFTAGSALQLISDKYTENKEPYLFRKSIAGDRELDMLVGGSIAWNQLQYNGDFSQGTYGWSTSTGTMNVNNGVMQFTSSITGGHLDTSNNMVSGHKFLSLMDIKTTAIGTVYVIYKSGLSKYVSKVNEWETMGKIYDPAYTGAFSFPRVYDARSSAWDAIEVRNCMLFDLTQMFGTAIADRLYAMEQEQAGSGVALFRSWFPKDYYPYNAGELMSVKTTAHEMVGFNQWDEEWESGDINIADGSKRANGNRIRSKNFIPVSPSETYYSMCNYQNPVICFYDEAKRWVSSAAGVGYVDGRNVAFTVPSWCYYVMFYCNGTTYNHDICISISSDRNGEYEPYTKHTYALDDVELRGVMKLDGTPYFDGDTYEEDGTVTRKYGIVDLGTLEYSVMSSDNHIFTASVPNLKSATTTQERKTGIFCARYPVSESVAIDASMTDKSILRVGALVVRDTAYTTGQQIKTALSGVYLVYELATPTTETADSFTSPQIVDAYGTERYVDERTVAVPVGHVTKYPDNLREKLDGLPWDFSTLIAPTEKAYKATRNYTVGSYLIMDNTLYKVTAAIASGGTITVGTNVAATTIMAEIIAAL